jgi:hypothetical protein
MTAPEKVVNTLANEEAIDRQLGAPEWWVEPYSS